MRAHLRATRIFLLFGATVLALAGCVSQAHRAVELNDMERLRSALNEEGAIERRNWKDQTPLILAAREDKAELVRYLVEQGAEIDAATEEGGYTALRWACQNGNLELTRYLIDNGADVTQTNESGWTPLHTAAKYGHAQIVKLLVKEGAEIDAQTDSGVTPARVAGQNDYVDISLYLLMTQKERQGEILE